jgi:adenine-specific DNA-methyltransferase
MSWNDDQRKYNILDKPSASEIVLWPIDSHGAERIWDFIPSTAEEELKHLIVREDQHGNVAVYRKWRLNPEGLIPLTWWDKSVYSAAEYGSNLLSTIFGSKHVFQFPKSVYAVRDCIKVAVGDKKDAVVLDFFAGSGTTLHAVNLLNAEDGGKRRCILVTNNEVSEAESTALEDEGFRPGDVEWERHGVCQSVTFPRCKFVIDGKRHDGVQLSGDYLSGRYERKQIRRSFRSLDFTTPKILLKKRAREAFALAVGFTKSRVTGNEYFLLGEGEKVGALLDPNRLDQFIQEGEEWAETVETIYLPFPAGSQFDEAREKLTDLWPALEKSIEVKRPMKEGFSANLDYFRLDFLDRAQVETGGNLADILPALWMMTGCLGKVPTCKGNEKMLFFKDCPFAILVEESAIKPFLANLEKRPDIEWVFLVTNDQDSFSQMFGWMPEHIPATQRIHLWRNYVDNFLINVVHAAGESP